MLIDPFTVIVQIINFAVLLVALKVVLFDRIVRHMDERQQRLAEQREQVAAVAERRVFRRDERAQALEPVAKASPDRRAACARPPCAPNQCAPTKK